MDMEGGRGVIRRNHVFIDGQNFYLSARTAFGIRWPDFDPVRLGTFLSEAMDPGAGLRIHFYTGMPLPRYSPHWSNFWENKIAAIRRDGAEVTTRPLRYLTETDPSSPEGFRVLGTREKGIDLRLGLDAVAAARRADCANIMIVSRDQDFTEVTEDIAEIARETGRDIGIWSAYPFDPGVTGHFRGIDGTRQIRINREDYARLRDPRDHRRPTWPGTTPSAPSSDGPSL